MLFVSYAAALGGAERLLLDQAAALRRPVALACPEGPLAVAAREHGHAVWPLRSRRLELRASPRDRVAAPLRLAAQAREVRRVVARASPTCVVAWSMRGLLVAAAAMAGARARPLAFAHNDLIPSGAVGRLVRLAAGRAELVIAASQAIARDLDPAGTMAVEVVQPGVDLERFCPATLPDHPSVLVAGALVPWKQLDVALEIVALARRELPGLTVAIAGEPLGDTGRLLQEHLERRAAEPDLDGSVRLLGPVADMPAALARATCLLHCADREPFGLVLAEALAVGRPVVAPGAFGPIEIVDDTCGRLYEPGDIPAAAAALVDALSRAGELSGPARTRAVRHFGAPASGERFGALIGTLA